MTVVDTSVVVDHLLGSGSASTFTELVQQEDEVAAPDVLVFEALSALRRLALRGELRDDRGQGAVEDLGDLEIELLPALPLRGRAWRLRRNLTASDALFVALAEELGEPLATNDAKLASATRQHSTAAVVLVR